jgi:hypothetical protein
VAADEVILDKVYYFVGVSLTFKLEIEAFVHFHNVQGPGMSIVLQDHLLEVHQGSLVVDALPDLDLGVPGMGRE